VFRLGQQVPLKIAMELVLTGEPMSSADALRWGLVNKVVPDGTVVEAALELAGRIAANAPLAVQASKRIAYGVTDGARLDEQGFWAANDAELGVFGSEDALEGPTAFAQKRAPVWKAR
jgi:crotonobetainyl-CoA hydratase